ncbi:unnamed protein product [Choristocarpus tenellus]
MEFRKCSVGGVSYGRGVTDIGRAVMQRRGEEVPPEDLAEHVIAEGAVVPHVRFHDPQMFSDLAGARGEKHRALMADFLLCLALCHTVIPEHAVGEEEGQPVLSASSPDDEALVLGARYFGVDFRDRVDDFACVRWSGPLLDPLEPVLGGVSTAGAMSGTLNGRRQEVLGGAGAAPEGARARCEQKWGGGGLPAAVNNFVCFKG